MIKEVQKYIDFLLEELHITNDIIIWKLCIE